MRVVRFGPCRRDIDEFIHKVWLTQEHEDVPGAAVTPVVAPISALAGGNLAAEPGTQKGTTMYDVGSVAVGRVSMMSRSFMSYVVSFAARLQRRRGTSDGVQLGYTRLWSRELYFFLC